MKRRRRRVREVKVTKTAMACVWTSGPLKGPSGWLFYPTHHLPTGPLVRNTIKHRL